MQLGIYNDELVSGLSEMVETVHQEDGQIVAQIVHCTRVKCCSYFFSISIQSLHNVIHN